MTKVFTIAHMPQELAQQWLQHLRDFDVAHPGCHFEVGVEPPRDVTVANMVAALQIDPALTFTQVFERGAQQWRWIGCGECDPLFDCHEGRTRCIRWVENGRKKKAP